MADDAAPFGIGGWILTRDPDAPRANPSARLRQAEEMRRWADAVAAEAAIALHDDAQRMVPRHVAGTKNNPGMAFSVRTGTLVTELGYEAAVEEIAAVRSVSVVTARMDLDRFEVLATDLREVLEAWKSGTIGSGYVRVLAQQALKIQPRRIPEPSGTEATDAAVEEWARAAEREQRSVRGARNELGRKLLADAPGRTPGEVERRAKRLLENYDPASFSKRSAKAREQRSIRLERGKDGMAYLTAHIESAKAEAIWDRLHRQATMLRHTATAPPNPATEPVERPTGATPPNDPGETAALGIGPIEPRTMDQLRADTFTDHLLAGPHGSGLENVAADVIIAIPSTILPGTPGGPVASMATPTANTTVGRKAASEKSGTFDPPGQPMFVADACLAPGADLPEILGAGPVDQESAAQLMNNARTWTRVVTDPVTGAMLNWGRKRYRPTKAQRRALLFRHHTCCVPGCTNRGKYAQADHKIEWQHGGQTDMGNLALLCARCHRLKSLGVLTTSLTPNGTLTATTLWGTTRISRPDAPWATDIIPAPPTDGATLTNIALPAPDTRPSSAGAWKLEGPGPEVHGREDDHLEGACPEADEDSDIPPLDVEERLNAALFASPEAMVELPPIDVAAEISDWNDRQWTAGELSLLHQENQAAWDNADGDLYPWFHADLNTMDKTPAGDPERPPRHTRKVPPAGRRQPLTRMRPRAPLTNNPRSTGQRTPGHAARPAPDAWAAPDTCGAAPDAWAAPAQRAASNSWASAGRETGTPNDSDPPF